jgi:hypothetical protein
MDKTQPAETQKRPLPDDSHPEAAAEPESAADQQDKRRKKFRGQNKDRPKFNVSDAVRVRASPAPVCSHAAGTTRRPC